MEKKIKSFIDGIGSVLLDPTTCLPITRGGFSSDRRKLSMDVRKVCADIRKGHKNAKI